MNLQEYCEKLIEGSPFEKILVSKKLRNIKGKKIKYIAPWKKMMRKAGGTYISVPGDLSYE